MDQELKLQLGYKLVLFLVFRPASTYPKLASCFLPSGRLCESFHSLCKRHGEKMNGYIKLTPVVQDRTATFHCLCMEDRSTNRKKAPIHIHRAMQSLILDRDFQSEIIPRESGDACLLVKLRHNAVKYQQATSGRLYR